MPHATRITRGVTLAGVFMVAIVGSLALYTAFLLDIRAYIDKLHARAIWNPLEQDLEAFAEEVYGPGQQDPSSAFDWDQAFAAQEKLRDRAEALTLGLDKALPTRPPPLPPDEAYEAAIALVEIGISDSRPLLPYIAHCGTRPSTEQFRTMCFKMAWSVGLADTAIVALNAWRLDDLHRSLVREQELASQQALDALDRSQHELLSTYCDRYQDDLWDVVAKVHRVTDPVVCSEQISQALIRLAPQLTTVSDTVSLRRAIARGPGVLSARRWRNRCGCSVHVQEGPKPYASVQLSCGGQNRPPGRDDALWFRLEEAEAGWVAPKADELLTLLQAQLSEFQGEADPEGQLRSRFGASPLGCGFRYEEGRYVEEGVLHVDCPDSSSARAVVLDAAPPNTTPSRIGHAVDMQMLPIQD